METKATLETSAARAAPLACLMIATALGCASSGQQRRHETLSAEWRAAALRGAPASRDDRPFGAAQVLDRRVLVAEVLRRNPSLDAARAAWGRALARYPQATALEDPMLEYSFAPLSIAAEGAPFGQSIELSQRFPWPGKRAASGALALAEAAIARGDYEAARLQLASAADALFHRYYAVARALDINDAHRALIEDIKAAAEAQYAAGRATQQEPLQAELELARVERERISLLAERGAITAQLNGLLHRRPDLPLPPPPVRLELAAAELPSAQALQDAALRERPELRGSRARLEGGTAALELAERAYYPDLGVMASYSSMWMDPEHRFMVGVSVNLPLQLGARAGAVDEAAAARQKAAAELAEHADRIRVEVEQARQRLLEAQEVARVVRERLLPAARAQLEAARIGYETGRLGFQALIEAERTLRGLELEHETALAEVGRTRAELDRAIGRVPFAAAEGEAP